MQSDTVADIRARLENAVRARPDIAEFHHDLGVVLFADGEWELGIASLQRAIDLRPNYPDALDNLGVGLQSLNRNEEAVRYHERALELNPVRVRTHHHLGVALLNLGRYEEAHVRFKDALSFDPGCPEAHNGLGVACQKLGDLPRSIECYQAAVEKKPAFPQALCNLGIALREIGKRAEAIASFERAVDLEPDNGRYYRYLMDSRRELPGGKHVPVMEALAAEHARPQERTELHFALAKAYIDLERYDEAFAQLRAANRLRRVEVPYDEERIVGTLETQPRTFTREIVEALRESGNPSERPLFVVGMPRSGSTLVEQLIAAHSDVHGAGELNAFEAAVEASGFLSAPSSREELRAALRRMGNLYVDTLAAYPDAPRVTDKMPLNFRFAGLIHLALPNARMIHVRRNPLDTCISCYSTYFVDGMPFSNNLEELGRYYAAYDRLMQYWHRIIPPERLLLVQYEELVANFEAQARRIIAFCGLDWQPASLEFHKVDRPIRTASHSQVRQPLYNSAVGRARHFGEHLRPLMDALRR